MGKLAVEGGEIHYEHHRGGSKSLSVLLSHGWGMSCRAWDDVTAYLTDTGYDVVAYDHRNCGLSSKDFVDGSIGALGDDVVRLVDTLGLEGVVLNGWSLGGAVVVDAAEKLGGRVAGLVSTGGATPRYTQADDFPHGGQAADVAGTVAALRAGRIDFLNGLYGGAVFVAPVSEATIAQTISIALQASPAADQSLAALAEIDQRTTMAALDVPALVIFGDQDQVVDPAIGAYAAEQLPQGRLVQMAGCGHAPFLEDPNRYRDALGGFLEAIA